MFPCKYSGTFTAMLAQTFIDAPLDLASAPHLQSLESIQAALRPQYGLACANAVATSEVSACVSDLDWQISAWISWQCSDEPNTLVLDSRGEIMDEPPKVDNGIDLSDENYFTTTSTSSGSSSAKLTQSTHRQHASKRRRAASAAAFRAEVASVLNLGHQNWTLADVDIALGLQLPLGTSTSLASSCSDKCLGSSNLSNSNPSSSSTSSTSSRGDNNRIDKSGPGGEPFGLCGDLSVPVPKVPEIVEDGEDEDYWTVLVVGLDFGMAPSRNDKDMVAGSTSGASLGDSNAFFSELLENQSPLFRSASHWRYQDYILRDLLGGLVGSGADVRVCVDPPTWNPAVAAAADAACAKMIAFARGPKRSDSSEENRSSGGDDLNEPRVEVTSSWTSQRRLSCGPCAPPPSLPSSSFSSSSSSMPSPKFRVVLVTAARGSSPDEVAATSTPREATGNAREAGKRATTMDRSITLAARWQPWLAAVVHVHDEPPPPFYAWPPQLKGLKKVRQDKNTETLFKFPHTTAGTDLGNAAKSSIPASSNASSDPLPWSSPLPSSSPSTFDRLLEQDPPDVASAIEGPVRDWAFKWASKLQLLYTGRAPKDQAEALRRADQKGREKEQNSPRSLRPPLVLRTYPLAGGAAAALVAMQATGNEDDEAARDFSSSSNYSSPLANHPSSAHSRSTPNGSTGGRQKSSEPFSSKEKRLFVVPVGWYTGFLGDYESGPAAVLKYLCTGNEGKCRFRRRQRGHQDKPSCEIKSHGGNEGEAGDNAQREGDERTNLWSFAGLRSYRFAAVTPHRHAMVNLFRGLGAPHSIHLVDATAPIDTAPPPDAGNKLLAPSAVRDMYQRALVVPSPRGDSLDGFRHYEAIVTGAVPVVDAPSNHPHWSWTVNQRQVNVVRANVDTATVNRAERRPDQTKTRPNNINMTSLVAGGWSGLSMQALGWVFPAPLRVETRGTVTDNTGDENNDSRDSSSHRKVKGVDSSNTTPRESQTASKDLLEGFPAHWPPPPSELSRDWLALLLDRPGASRVPIHGSIEDDGTGEFVFTDWSKVAPNDYHSGGDPQKTRNGTAAGSNVSHREEGEEEDTLSGWTLSPWRHLSDRVRVIVSRTTGARMDGIDARISAASEEIFQENMECCKEERNAEGRGGCVSRAVQEDELWLRRQVSGRWYLSAICDARRRLHDAVFTT